MGYAQIPVLSFFFCLLSCAVPDRLGLSWFFNECWWLLCYGKSYQGQMRQWCSIWSQVCALHVGFVRHQLLDQFCNLLLRCFSCLIASSFWTNHVSRTPSGCTPLFWESSVHGKKKTRKKKKKMAHVYIHTYIHTYIEKISMYYSLVV